MKIRFFILFLFLSLGLLGCVHTRFTEDSLSDIPAFYKVNDNLYCGGRPDLSGCMRLKELGVKSILSLEDFTDDFSTEEKISDALGLKFYNLPLSLEGLPTDKEILEFLGFLIDKEKLPIFVHGKSGRDITMLMLAIYRVVIEDWSSDAAYKEARDLSTWQRSRNRIFKRYIYQLKD